MINGMIIGALQFSSAKPSSENWESLVLTGRSYEATFRIGYTSKRAI
jgi:hypothetical protein